ncbi:PBSX family phage terminase large subunit [Lactiplantibacillus plantarum]|nr:PBSX family phage terminase large subunit [Lactiplantibacillus plantarum]
MNKKQNILNQILTGKQQTVLRQGLFNSEWKLMVNYGAVRSGKTIVDNYLFLYELKQTAKLASQQGYDNPLYILAGVSSKTIWNNVLNPLANDFGIDFKFDRYGNFNLYGVTVVQAYTGSISGLGAIRGMTAWGAYINEASLANEEVFNEIRDRCSKGSKRIICDTNPDIPTHWLKRNYIDNPGHSKSIISNHFVLTDNTFLDDDYIQTKKETTPSGMFYDRSILGLWVSGEGAVYRDFDERKMVVSNDMIPSGLSYVVGVDWGYEHKGSIVVFGVSEDDTWYLLEEHTQQFREIGYWLNIASNIQERYGQRIPFYCDSARPEHVAAFSEHGINAINGYKSRLTGVENVASLMKANHFFVTKEAIDNRQFSTGQDGYHYFLDEVYQYVWDEKTGEPVKQNDDVMDAMRYAVASQMRMMRINQTNNHSVQANTLRNFGI